MKEAGRKAFICGNIGRPFSAEVNNMKAGDFVSLEVSSFQLEKISEFKPKISVILNFSPNHLDRYKDIREYLAAKKRIFMNQDEGDYLVLNKKDRIIKSLAASARARVVYFQEKAGLNPNQAAVICVGRLLGIDQEICCKVFQEFKGIEHRLEDVVQINGIRFINDSKSTTADSTLWALRSINSPIILIAGGKDKGVDYGVIRASARQRVRQLILIGEAKEKIHKALKDVVVTTQAESLEEAVEEAFKKARRGDCVLFSPMCSSFDMFSDFEERGTFFKKAVFGLKNSLQNL
ncbi:MAG: hypothetical protein DRP74_09275 [Candidatus Omnitrophota bacterium]|nr:MAG: hypothetical protein DRP74_09275 [Candidatus Omnitrophota bacterium]